MTNLTFIQLPCLLLVLMLAGMDSGQAAPKTSDGGATIKKAQGIIRLLNQEKSALEAEKAAWLTEKADLESKLSGLESSVKQLKPLQTELEHYKTGLEMLRSNLEGQLSQERQRQQALLKKHNEVVTKARSIRDDNILLVKAVQEREQWIAQTVALNKGLQEVNQQLIGKYKDKGFWQQLAELEPLTGIGRVETENQAEQYRYKLKQLKVTPFEATVTQPVKVEQRTGATEPPADVNSGSEVNQ